MKKLLVILTLVLIVVLVIGVVSPATIGIARYVDRTAPVVKLEKVNDPHLAVRINVEDELQNIAELQLELVQGASRSLYPLDDLNLLSGKSLSLSIPIKSLAQGVKEGSVLLEVRATDTSYWKNSAQQIIELEIDKRSPKLEIQTTQHKMFAGGSELVGFKASDENLDKRKLGVTLAGNFFRAVALSKLFPNEEYDPDLYVSLFAAPLSLKSDDFKPLLVAEDVYGNRSTQPLHLRFFEKKVPSASPSLSAKFMERKIPPLLEEASIDFPEKFSNQPESWKDKFILVNEDYRKALRDKLEQLVGSRFSDFAPKSELVRPLGGSLMSGFGEQRSYSFQGKDAGFSVHEGFDLASVARDSVVSTGAGEVILAEDFGIYGKTVVIDHGLGLSSLYGHLSSLEVQVGDKIAAGDKIGLSGQTGLAGGDHLHFELRVGFVPVTPIEWWDKKWFGDDFALKINEMKELLDG